MQNRLEESSDEEEGEPVYPYFLSSLEEKIKRLPERLKRRYDELVSRRRGHPVVESQSSDSSVAVLKISEPKKESQQRDLAIKKEEEEEEEEEKERIPKKRSKINKTIEKKIGFQVRKRVLQVALKRKLWLLQKILLLRK